jgi:hypothetical protein
MSGNNFGIYSSLQNLGRGHIFLFLAIFGRHQITVLKPRRATIWMYSLFALEATLNFAVLF